MKISLNNFINQKKSYPFSSKKNTKYYILIKVTLCHKNYRIFFTLKDAVCMRARLP